MTKKEFIEECERQNAIRREQQFAASTLEARSHREALARLKELGEAE